jgi:hypothetical protein
VRLFKWNGEPHRPPFSRIDYHIFFEFPQDIVMPHMREYFNRSFTPDIIVEQLVSLLPNLL